MESKENNQEPPAATVTLCQVNERVSCGACCGLYNVPHLAQGRLSRMLARRTELFAAVARTEDDLYDFKRRIEGWTPPERPFPLFHHCPFLGLIGRNRRRVGCMLHPQAPGNQGVDWRHLSHYGGLACRTYFCPSLEHLSPVRLQILQRACDHWYLYGLIVTEHRLLNAFFQEIERRIGRPLAADDVAPSGEAAVMLRKLAALKIAWPYRRPDGAGPCNYFFENQEYPRPPLVRGKGVPSSRFDAVFSELESEFITAGDLCAAERLLEDLFARLVRVLENPNG